MTGQRYKRATLTMDADIGDEIVAMHVERGDCFGFNEVAASVWRQLAEPQTSDELRDHLLSAYDVSSEQCSLELHELLVELVANGMVEKVS